MAPRIVSAVFKFKLPGLQRILNQRQGIRLAGILLKLFDSWGETLGYSVLSLDLEQDRDTGRFVALLELQLQHRHKRLSFIEEMLDDPDDDGNYPVRVGTKEFLIHGRGFRVYR